MKTAHYTFTTWNERAMASGFDGAGAAGRQGALVREPQRPARPLGRDNVIDLTAWRAANLDEALGEPEELDGEYGGDEWEEPELPAPRPRRSRRSMLTAELVSTLSVVAAATALIVRVLTF